MNIHCILAGDETANIIRNLYPLYLHDLSEFSGVFPNQYGIYEDDNVKTLVEQFNLQDIWFQKPGVLFPYIIYVDNKPAGFALVSTGQYAPKTTDNYLYEFFLLRPYRGKNIAGLAAENVLDKFNGKWELYTNPSLENIRAQRFWTKTIEKYTSGNYHKSVGNTFDGKKMIFRFENPKS